MKKWINNLSFALWTTAALATGTTFALTSSLAASAACAATAASLPDRLDPQRNAAQDMAVAMGQHVRLDADGKRLSSQGSSAREAGNDHDKPHVLASLTPYPNGTGK